MTPANPCGNNSTCTYSNGSSICNCQNGWTGPICITCNSDSVCLNNGTCNKTSGMCECLSGFFGHVCEYSKY